MIVKPTLHLVWQHFKLRDSELTAAVTIAIGLRVLFFLSVTVWSDFNKLKTPDITGSGRATSAECKKKQKTCSVQNCSVY